MIRKPFYLSIFFTVALSISLTVAGVQKGDESLGKLMDGNKRFVSGGLGQKDIGDSKRKELTKGQSPAAIVVTCSDSRVAPEIIFDQGLGEIFVVRIAGNVLDPISLGSIEYAAEHLHTPLLVIMGHDKCGAVAASLEAKGKPEGNIGAIVKKILPAVRKAWDRGGSNEELLDRTIRENALLQNRAVWKSPVLKHLISEGKLKVATALYHLGSGEVEILKADIGVPSGTGHKH